MAHHTPYTSPGGSSYEVKVAQIDTIYKDHWSKHSDRVFLLKMDCEGHDPKVWSFAGRPLMHAWCPHTRPLMPTRLLGRR